MSDREPDGPPPAPGAPGPEPGRRGGRRGLTLLPRPGKGSPPSSLREWIRLQPGLAIGVLLFCVIAVVGLIVTLPRGTLIPTRPGKGPGGASVTAGSVPADRVPAARPDPASRGPDSPAPAAEAPGAPGAWVHEGPSDPSPRGLALSYLYRTLPPGGESRYEWVVQVRGARPVLDGVEVVSWRMEPSAKNGADFTSRDRAGDGFPLFGHGPGGWFGVSATVRYKDGGEETLTRRIEFPE